MTEKAYNKLSRKEARAHDLTITAALTALPRWVEEWQEYAAIDASGRAVVAETSRQCSERREYLDDVILKNARALTPAQ